MDESSSPDKELQYKGHMRAHGGWITSLAVGEETIDGTKQEFLLSGSRDRTIIKWELFNQGDNDESECGRPRKLFTGHSHFISELCLTGDSRFAFSSSWDHSVRLWNVGTGACVSQLTGHTKDVLSVAISADDRQILTGSLDNQIKIWNTRCECKHTVDKNSHTDAVSCVKFYHAAKPAICVTASWDKTIKVWDNQYMTLMYTFIGHKGQITTLDMVNGSNYLASGSLDGHIMVWDLVKGLMLLKLDAESPINAVLFSQKLYWLVIGTENGIRVLDIPKQKFIQDITATSLKPNEVKRSQKNVGCTSLAWSKNSMTLYSGWTDNTIRTYNIEDLGKTA